MSITKEQVAARLNVRAITQFLALAGVATILPFFIHLQWITGPIINAVLILTLFMVGVRSALVISMAPSLMALSGGLLPAILAPVVPFIMISNAILVLSIDQIYQRIKDDKKGYWIGLGAGSLLKFIFLYSSVGFITPLLIRQELGVKVAQMMSWPQLMTALTGGLIAFIALKWLRRI